MVAQFIPGTQLDDVGAPFMIVLPSLSQLVSEVPFYSKNNSDVNYAMVPQSAAVEREPALKTAPVPVLLANGWYVVVSKA